ncbi:bifunctional diaminohydroxyphosphoribosylaminopyrimidine deaminase/5-amino-6-(5-phosphoribosylamino)uracil reductase RibD [Nitrosomonas sp.]|uniref:bifunctional diaminohydroxyphosphoribosylaminopyrimidine deaminase/5-amino-6-(5-phosphoribosylamino)uracil reductase RibD n=1 Tax=Nitrosomonas sp. TaxID=42353 RepID=UPI001D9FF127|nr:bifunctional diaminohydroxyphosphoribosylaminopyrimidine deaminase/5-amino-6-(5-phosphoribosylamino)uracil reductase RibD [Nitrosomonas sp.]MCB1948877.1 bifunctional diaminohydroxyphosphoribosylaminopyrimidine deaminase/5-amino-6-(5-phosphoribosylamino)uracil reductase RibD [Nitrosomonas sp.]
MFSPADYTFMAQALQLAEKGLYTTTPNPRVGCVITQDDQIVGSGWHEKAGQAHAEINALAMAGDKARGATVYVTLEPCTHHGRTPPCVEALIRAAVARVVIAMEDPNPLVSGSGIQTLKQVGIEVQSGLLQEQAWALNSGFVKRMQHRRPWVRLKIAVSLDGKTALNNGQSQWISSEAARIDGHRWRARSCAVLTGIGTILSDNPQLTVRHISASRQPKKVIIDNRLAIPADARVLQGEDVFIFTASVEETSKIDRLEKTDTAQVIVFEGSGRRVNLNSMIETLAKLGLNEILVEAGTGLSGALIQDGLVDELIVYMAPSLLGSEAKNMFQLPEMVNLDQKIALSIEDVRMIGRDIRIIARL